MCDEFRQSFAFLPCRSDPRIWIPEPSQSHVKKFIRGRSASTCALSVEGPPKNELRRTIMFSSHPPQPMIDERRLPDRSPGNNCKDVLPVRWVMSARPLPGCPVRLMDDKTRHWIG